VPFSLKFVRHIAGWYAQKHPDEDFAETFAVWLTPGSEWKRRYAGWPAMKKLQYVERMARELAAQPPRKALEVAVRELPVEEMGSTIEEFYRQHLEDESKTLADLLPDAELEDIFVRKGEDLRPAAAAYTTRSGAAAAGGGGGAVRSGGSRSIASRCWKRCARTAGSPSSTSCATRPRCSIWREPTPTWSSTWWRRSRATTRRRRTWPPSSSCSTCATPGPARRRSSSPRTSRWRRRSSTFTASARR